MADRNGNMNGIMWGRRPHAPGRVLSTLHPCFAAAFPGRFAPGETPPRKHRRKAFAPFPVYFLAILAQESLRATERLKTGVEGVESRSLQK